MGSVAYSNNHKCEILHFALFKYKHGHSMHSLYSVLLFCEYGICIDLR